MIDLCMYGDCRTKTIIAEFQKSLAGRNQIDAARNLTWAEFTERRISVCPTVYRKYEQLGWTVQTTKMRKRVLLLLKCPVVMLPKRAFFGCPKWPSRGNLICFWTVVYFQWFPNDPWGNLFRPKGHQQTVPLSDPSRRCRHWWADMRQERSQTQHSSWI